MGTIKEWFFDNFNTKSSIKMDAKTFDFLCQTQELVYNKYAQSIVAEKYGSLLAQCDFITFVDGEIVEKDTWYRLNVQPNPNQSSSEFLKQLTRHLIFDGEALIIKTETNDLYVANSFAKTGKQMAQTEFTQVVIDVYEDGSVPELDLQKTYKGENAIYIRYANPNVQEYIAQMNKLYADLIKNVQESGNFALKYALGIDTTALNGVDIDIEEQIKEIIDEQYKAIKSKGHAVLPMLNGFKLEVLNPANNNSQNAATASNNVNNMFEDICVNVGNIYNMPKSFMLGTYEKNDMDEFLTFGLDPLCTLISECINRKYYGKKQILEKTYCRLDSKKVKHFDILTISDSINKLVSSGVYSINEVRELLEEPLIDSEIGDKHWITRNYAVVGDYIQEMTNYTNQDKKTQGNAQNEPSNE